jgi:hypothetical protein
MAIKTSVSSHQLKRLQSKFSESTTLPANPKKKPRKAKPIQKAKKMSGNVQSMMAKASAKQKVAAEVAEQNRQEWLAKKAEEKAKSEEVTTNESK